MEKYDVIIIGAGPAGLSAAIYTTRRALKTLVLSMDIGGQMASTLDIENYPGFQLISGTDLSNRMMQQAKKSGAEIIVDQEVEELSKKGDIYIVKTKNKEYQAEAVILAFGKKPRELNVPGDEKYRGKGVSYCATCDGPLFKNRIVTVVGGGNSALDAALYLAKIAKKVYLIHRRDQFRGDEILVRQVEAKNNIELILNSVVTEILGEETVKKVKVKNVKTEKLREIETEGVFIEIGFVVAADFIKDLVKVDKINQVIIDIDCRTSDPGIFAAGDLNYTPYKQIVIAAGQGAVAALSAYDYIQKKKGKLPVRIDWGKKG